MPKKSSNEVSPEIIEMFLNAPNDEVAIIKSVKKDMKREARLKRKSQYDGDVMKNIFWGFWAVIGIALVVLVIIAVIR